MTNIAAPETSPPHDAPSAPTAPTAQGAPVTEPSPTPSGTPKVDDKPTALDDLIGPIRASVAPGVSTEVRAAGAAACRAVLTALEAQIGQPLTTAPTTTSRSALATMLAQLAAMPREQILEFLRNQFPAGTAPAKPTAPTAGPRFHLIQIPQLQRPGGGA